MKGNLGAGETALWFLRRGLVDAAVGLAEQGADRGTDSRGGDDDRAQIKSLLDRDEEGEAGEAGGGAADGVGVTAAQGALAGWPETVWREAQARRLLTL